MNIENIQMAILTGVMFLLFVMMVPIAFAAAKFLITGQC